MSTVLIKLYFLVALAYLDINFVILLDDLLIKTFISQSRLLRKIMIRKEINFIANSEILLK